MADLKKNTEVVNKKTGQVGEIVAVNKDTYTVNYRKPFLHQEDTPKSQIQSFK